MQERIKKCTEFIRNKTDFVPQTVIVLGTGLGGLYEDIKKVFEIKYSDIDGFPVSTVKGHDGKFVFGVLEGVNVAIMEGRIHNYEGYAMDETVLPVRVLCQLGAKNCIFTNAAGGINEAFAPGDFMVIDDHISLFMPSTLRGPNIDYLGERFPDMSEAYDKKLREKITEIAKQNKIDIKHGVYVQLPGPSFETPAEIRMLKTLGADAVGMSTVCEVIAARHMGLRVCAVSCISNMAAGISKQPLSHQEVLEAGEKNKADFRKLIHEIVKVI